jgi:hypothetical protein
VDLFGAGGVAAAASRLPFPPHAQSHLPAELLGNILNLPGWSAAAQQSAAAAGAGTGAAAAALPTDSAGQQDIAAAMVLCEAIYRAADYGEEQASQPASQPISRR